MSKTIGVMTSGGDCAGLNAAIRAIVTRAVMGYGWSVKGIRYATQGLMTRPVDAFSLGPRAMDGQMLQIGGTVLGTVNTGNPFSWPLPDGGTVDRSAEVLEGLNMLGLDALIAIGGDGSLRILHRLMKMADLPFIAIPKTIDNDVRATDRAIGFESAVSVATSACDSLRSGAMSQRRIMILEVMGREAGHIALATGIAGGADAILIPEIPVSLERVAAAIQERCLREERDWALVVVAEAVRREDGKLVTDGVIGEKPHFRGISSYIAERLSALTGRVARATVLGHLQRGDRPNAADRLIASSLGVAAVDLVAQHKRSRMVAWQKGEVVDVALEDAAGDPRLVDPAGSLVAMARGLGICFGD
jgi:6-phosphofructokinase 1